MVLEHPFKIFGILCSNCKCCQCWRYGYGNQSCFSGVHATAAAPVQVRCYASSSLSIRQPLLINRAKDFMMYDYGRSKNKEHYGQVKSPAYDIDRVTAQIALFSSEGDTVAHPEDVSLFVERLGSNLLFYYVVEPTNFRHLDFCWGYRANDIVHNLMLDTLEKYSGTSTRPVLQ